MMYNQSKEDLRAMRKRANEIYKKSLWPCTGMSLLYTVVSLALSVLTLFIANPFLYAVTLLVLAFIAASLQLGLCEYFLRLRRGERPGARLLIRYFDQDSLPMVAVLALINWAAGMVGMLLVGLSFLLTIVVSALVFLAPYLYVLREGKGKPVALLREGITRMQGRWDMYIRILVRQYLYAIVASLAASMLMMLAITALNALGLAAFFSTTVGYMACVLVVSAAVNAFITAYFQIYLAEFASATLEPLKSLEPEKQESDFIL